MKKSLIIVFNLILFFSLITFSYAVEEYEFLQKWNTNKDTWQNPTGVAVDKDGNVYVAGQQKIVKYTRDGTYVFHIENIPNSENYFISSHDMRVAVDDSGNIYVSCWNDNMIIKFDSQGNYVTKWATWDDGGTDQFNNPEGIAVDDSGNVYVCDHSNHRIVKFSVIGENVTHLATWGGTQGGGDDQFSHPSDIAIFDSDNIYIADCWNYRVKVYNSDGVYQNRKWGTQGFDDGKFMEARGIAVDFEGNVYVVDPSYNRISKFSSDGTFMLNWGMYGDDNYHFYNPRDVEVDYTGTVIIADRNNNRIIEYKRTGAPTIEITNPVQDEFVKADVTISANVTVPAGYTISNVEFYRGVTPLNTDNDAPYEFSWDTTAETNQAYTIWAVATNNEGAKTKEKVPVIVANNDSAPTAFSITNPADQEQILDTETIAASTSDDLGITKVEFYVDDALVDTDTVASLLTYNYNTYPWDTTTVNDGEKVLKVIFYDTIGQFTSDTITVTVENQEEIGYIDKWYTNSPSDVVLDSDGNLYVSGNSRIKKYAPDGTYISKIEPSGNEDFNLDWRFFIAIDNSGNIYASNPDSHNIVKFDSDGNYVTKWGSFGQDDDQFHSPQGIACDSAGNVYVSDNSNHRISKFSSDGTFITSWGTQGGGDGQFNNPHGIAIDASDNVYVADRHNGRIQIFTSNGTFQSKWSSGGSGENHFDCPGYITLDSLGNLYMTDDCYHRVLKFASNGTYITELGSLGSNNLQFHIPEGLAVDADFYVYVADRNNSRVVKLRSTWLQSVSMTNPTDSAVVSWTYIIQVTASSAIDISKVEFYIDGTKVGEDTDNAYEYSWDTTAGADGTYTLKAIAYNTQDNSQETDEISVIVNNSSDALPTVSLTSPADGDIIRLQATFQAVATDPEELIDRVEFYVNDVKVGEDTDNSDSTYEYTWDATTVEDGERVIKVVAFDTIGQNVEESVTVTVINHEEFGYITKWSLDRPSDVVLDKDGNLYVAGGHMISKYTPNGTLISRIENIGSDYDLTWWFCIAVDDLGNIYATNRDRHQVIKFDSSGNYVTKWGSYGDGNNQFNGPTGIAVDSDAYIYVCDDNNHRISKFSSDGTFEKTWGSNGSNDGLFQYPQGIAVDSSDNIYVVDRHNYRIQMFSSDGTFIRKWGQWGYEDHQLLGPSGIALDSEGNVYVGDDNNYKVVKFTSDGTFLSKWGSQGSGDLQFECPYGIAVDSDFYVYVADHCSNRITKFNSTWRPTVAITNPADNSVLITSPVTIQATTSSDITITKVEFYINGSKVGEDTTNAYEHNWITSSEENGAYTLKAIAYNAQNTTAESGEIYVVINKTEDALPTVSLTNPAEGDTIRLAATLQAGALDDDGISKVEFYVDDTMVSEDGFYPFEYTWDSTTVEDGQKVIKAIAYDTIGQNVEASINVTVINHEEFGYVSKWSGNNTSDVVVDKDGYVYVAGSSKIAKYTPDGNLVFKIEYTGNEEYYLDGWFHIAVDADGNIYASENESHNIAKFDSNGNYLFKWGTYGHGDYQFYNPSGIVADSEGNVYICDYNNNRIAKYDSEGTLITEWGTQGGNDGQFNNPHGIAVDSSDNIYVTDRHNNRIQVFDSDGEFLRRWGSHGYDDNQFRNPYGIAVDSEDNVYIVDGNNYRIVKYTSTGTFLAKWGNRGSGDLQFECMNGVAVDSDFYVYITDNCNSRITIFKSDWRPTVAIINPADNSVLTAPVTIQASASSAISISKVEFYKNGTLLGEATTTNPANGYYEYDWDTSSETNAAYTIRAIAYNAQNTTAESGEIYVVVKNTTDAPPTVSLTNPAEGDTVRLTTNLQADASDVVGMDRVEFYVDDLKIGEDTDNTDNTYEYTWDATTVEDGERVIKVVAFDTIGQNAEETITVTITNHEEFGYVNKWSHNHPTDVAVDKDGNIYIAGSHSISKYTPDGNLLLRIEEQQGADYNLSWWMHVAIDDFGYIYTSNQDSNSVVKFDSNGNYVTKWGSYGNGNDQFNNPYGIAVDSAANVYVVDHNNHRISKFNSDGTYLSEWGTQGGNDGQFQHPQGIAVDSSDNIYIIGNNHRVNVFNSDGEFLRRWGNHGYADTQFRWPQGIAVDSEGYVYVADTGNYRIAKYTSDGTFVTKWGTQGSGDLQFECPNSIAVDSDFNIYVTDNCNSRVTILKSTWLPAVEITNPADNSMLTEPVTIQATASSDIGISKVEFYINGVLVGEDTTNSYEYFWDTSLEVEGTHTIKVIAYNIQNITTESDEISVVVNNSGNEAPTVSITNPLDGEIIRKWVDIEADASDDTGIARVEFYIADALVSIDTEAPYMYNWDTATVGDGQTEVKAVAYDGIAQNTSDSIMVAVANQEAYEYISEFNTWNHGHPRSIAINQYGHLYVIFHERIVILTSSGSFLTRIDNEGSGGNYQLTNDMAVAVDNSGNIYVSNRNTHEIIKFDASGNYLTKWGSQGAGDDQFNAPQGLAVDSQGNVYVCDSDNHRIVKYTSDGTFLAKFGSQGHADGYFQYPGDIALDSENNMYVAEHWNNRIQVLDSDGTFVRKWGNWGYGDGEFQCVRGIGLDSQGNVYVADQCSNRVSKFSSEGEFITKWGSYGSGEGQLQDPQDVAVDSSGNVYVTDHSNRRIVVFRIIGTPFVEITSPLDNSSVSGTALIQATAESEFGIDRVEFYIDDALESSRTESPYVWNWDTTSYSNGSHEIKAVAYNTDLKTTETSISAVVNNGGDVAPTVSITNLDDGAVIRGTVLIKADAWDELGVEEVKFYMDETLLTTDTDSPYEYSWDTTTVADGEKELKVVAYDTIGQHTWISITVIVDNANNVFSIDLSEAAAIYIDAENMLRKIDVDGNIEPVINTDPFVEQFQFGPKGNLYIVFRHPQEARDGKSYILMKANPETNEFKGIDSSLTNLVWLEHSTTKNVQFDQQENIYYFAHADLGNNVWDRVLRKYVDEDNIEDIINRDMEIFHWLVRGDGTIIIAGRTRANNEEWLRKVNPIEASPDARVESITEPDWWWEWGWMAEFPDNLVYVTLNGSFLDLNGVYRLADDLPRLEQEDADAPYIGDKEGSLYKIHDLVAGHSEEYIKGITEMGRVQEMINYEIDDNGTVYGLAGHWYNKYRTVVKLYPEPMVIEPQLIDRAQAMKVSSNKLIIAGFNNLEGKYKIVLYDPLTDITTDLMPDKNIEIYLFDVQVNGNILFHGLDLDTNENIVAILELASPAPAGKARALGGYGFKELAELGGRPLSFGVFKEVSGTEGVTVLITSLSDNSTVSGLVTIRASASSPEEVSKVEFYIDGELIETGTASPYIYNWDTTGYSDGSHTIKVKVTDAAVQTAIKEITVTVNNSSPGKIILSTTRIDFATATNTNPTTDQKIVVENTGGVSLNWTATPTESWIQVSPPSGSGSGIVTVSVNASGLSIGTHTGKISIEDPNATNSPKTINVILKIYSSASVYEPFGSFDTPINETTGITGAVPLTGWALDDIEVTKIEIWREPVGGEPTAANGLVYIANAIQVEGARPDIASLYPYLPLNYQAGWGYMLLTNYLPDGGNGTYTFYAVAYDKEGNSAELGSTTIGCDNTNASEPFGTIDTPTEGGDASGDAFLNFAWALTPQPNYIEEDGSTIKVWINGEEVGQPDGYGEHRSDVADLFPGYANSDGAVGYYYLNTTEYQNGVHTIGWNVEDSGGNSADIGERYFTVINVDIMGTLGTGMKNQMVNLDRSLSFEYAIKLPTSFNPVRVRSGPRRDAEPEITEVDNYGVINIEIREVERVRVYFGEGADYMGYLIVGEELRPLPIGSTLNTEEGTFSWQPGAGFIGEYDLVFIKKDATGAKTKIKTRITILPKFSIY